MLNGSIGVCLDSNEATVGGATYQNTITHVTIKSIDVGVFLGVQVMIRSSVIWITPRVQ